MGTTADMTAAAFQVSGLLYVEQILSGECTGGMDVAAGIVLHGSSPCEQDFSILQQLIP